MEIVNYKIADKERQAKLLQFAKNTEPEDLQAELAAARLLAQEALGANNIPLTNLILTTVGKLAQSQVAVKKLKGDYLDRAAVMRIVTKVVDILTGTVANRFDGWDVAIDKAADQITQAIGEEK